MIVQGVPYAESIYADRISVKGQFLSASNRAFGERLKAAREGAGLTQVQLAGKVGVPQKQVSAWESGQHRPGTHERVAAAAYAVGATVGWLVSGEGKPPRHVTKQARDRLARIEREESEAREA